MYYLEDFCCICFSNKKELQSILDSDDDGITYISKLSSTIPIMCLQNIDYRLLCKKCCDNVDFVYKFRKQCLKSKTTLENYISKLASGNHIKCQLNVVLTDLNNITNNDNLDLTRLVILEKQSENSDKNYLNNMNTITDDIKDELIDVSRNVKLEFSNYVQDIQEHVIISDYISKKSITTITHPEDSKIADVCYDIKRERNEKLDVSRSTILTSPYYHDVKYNLTTTNYIIKEQIQTEIHTKDIDEEKDFDIRIEEVNIKTEYEDEGAFSDVFIEDINTKIGSNIPTDDSMHLNESEIKSEKKTSQWVCKVCNVVFEYFYLLEEHKSTHDDSEPHQCNICKEILSSTDLMTHMLIHTSRENKECHICNEKFTELSKFIKHMQIHTGRNINDDVNGYDYVNNVNTLVHTEEKHYECRICNKRFSQSNIFKKHKLSHTGEKCYECTICNKLFNRSYNLKQHMLCHTGEKPYECNKCNKKFNHPGSLTKHLLTHIGEKPYECSICNKKFTQTTDLKLHMMSHSGEKHNECNICNKSFCSPSYLKTHMLIHTGENYYECNICYKRVGHVNTYKAHMLSHTEGIPYECNICNKKFKQPVALKRHKHLHTGENECSICKKRFVQLSHLKKHMLSHAGEKLYECSTCNKKFSLAYSLKIHMLSHAEEKPYESSICNQTFSQSNNLKSHMMSHSAENPYECNTCHKKFRYSVSLKKHAASH